MRRRSHTTWRGHRSNYFYAVISKAVSGSFKHLLLYDRPSN